MSGYKQGVWQKADARVLGQILAAQNIVFALPNTIRITEYYAQTLISIPGIAACRVCLGSKSAEAGEPVIGTCDQCETLHTVFEGDSPFSPVGSNLKCSLTDQPDVRFITISSPQHHFGFFVLKIEDTDFFEVYHPFIINLANYLAIKLENRWQNDLLQQAHAELERKVEERTHDLLVANEELTASRRDMLSMMQDAVEARQQVEQANAVLRREVLQRKHAEEALRESEEKYRSLIQKVPTAIVLHDGQGHILIGNPLAQRLLGFSEEHLLGKSLNEPAWHFLREDGSVMPVSEYPVSLVRSSGQPLREYVTGIVRQDKLIWVLVNAEPEFADSGEIVRVIVSFIDITEKKQAEESLRKLSRAVEQSPVSIIITDTAGAIEYVNPRFTELTGYTFEEALGQNPNILKSNLTSPEEYAVMWKTILSGGVWQGEFCNKKKNGELYWEWASISPVIDHAGTVTNFVAAKENITERKRAEEAEQRRRRIAETLVKAAGVLNSTLDLDQVLDHILQQLRRAIHYDSASFLEKEDDYLVISVCQGFHRPHEVIGTRFSLVPNTPIYHVVTEKTPLHLADVDQEYPSFHDQDIASQYIRTWLGVPILSKDRVIGVVTLDRLEVRPFTDEDIELAMAFANQAAIAIDNAELHKQTQRYAEELERRVEARTVDLQQEILERKRAEEALRESEVRHRIIAELTSDYIYSIIVHPSDGTVETGWMSGAVDRITGYTAEEIRTLPGGWNSIALPGGIADFTLMQPRLLSGQTVVHEYQITTKSGEVRWLRDYKKPVWDEAEKHVALILGAVQDITERKQAEEALHERTVQLEAANEELRILSRAKDEFVSNVSHELRTPITSLKLRHYLLEKQPGDWKTHLAVLSRETDRLAQIIESLLYLSRLDQDRVDWQPTCIDLNSLVAQFVRDRVELAQSRELSLSFTGEPDLPVVEVDAALWEQALSILLTNAFNYTPSGGHVEVRTQTCERERQHWVGVSVSDTGLGISLDEQRHLFERFFRGRAGRESGTPGTGLGLSIVQEIVNKHGGRIEVRSAGIPGEGTTFVLWLPAHTQ